jgi:putative NIF3 family GTP cyclohydrolase 1 type 2
VGYHASLEAARQGLSVFELGHRESEHYFLKTIEAWMKEWKVPVSVLDERTQRII